MSTGPQRRARWIAMLGVATLAATLLVSGNAMLSPSPAAAWPAGCQSKQKVAFIGFPGMSDLEAMQAPLRALRKLWPVKKLQFHYTTSPIDLSGPGLDTLVDEVEAKVNSLEANGFNRIGLPSFSAFLNPFIHGTGGSLGGIPLQTRHPNSVFVTLNNGTSAVDDLTEAGNVFRFLDVPSLNESTELAVDNLIGPGGEMLVLYQEGDAASESVRDSFLGIATTLSVTAGTVALSYDGFDFNSLDIEQAAQAVDNVPAGSLVVHIVNGVTTVQDDYVAAALTDGHIFVDDSSSGPIRHFGGNFSPTSAIPVDLEYGYSVVDTPSWQSTRAGFPTKYQPWLDDLRQKLYMEAFGFLAKCGKFHGILDGFLKFDEGGTRINFQLERSYLPKGSTSFAVGARIENPRWEDDQVAWDWNAVFGE